MNCFFDYFIDELSITGNHFKKYRDSLFLPLLFKKINNTRYKPTPLNFNIKNKKQQN